MHQHRLRQNQMKSKQFINDDPEDIIEDIDPASEYENMGDDG